MQHIPEEKEGFLTVFFCALMTGKCAEAALAGNNYVLLKVQVLDDWPHGNRHKAFPSWLRKRL